jgi:hypothetical protein
VNAVSDLARRFPPGTRVRLNDAGMAVVRRLQNRSGVVVGYARDGLKLWLRWDGRRAREAWATVYVIRDPR